MNQLWARLREWARTASPIFLVVVPLAAYIGLVAGFDNKVLTSITTVMLIKLILVMSLQVFMGNSGVANFGHVGFMLVGAYASILFTLSPVQKSFTLPDMPTWWWIHRVHLPFFPSLLIAGGLGAVLGGLVGLPMLRLKRTAFGFGSFALLIIIRSVAVNLKALTRGTRTVVGIDRYTTLWVAAGWAIFSIMAAYLFKESGLGLKLRASRADDRAAANIGINVFWVRFVAWVFGCFLAAVSGGLWAHRITTLTPHAFWMPLSFAALMMLVVGGRASVSGAAVGTVVITMISEGVRMFEYWLNFNRESIPFLSLVFPGQVVGFTEFTLSIVLLLILYRRPAGIMKGREFTWPFGSKEPSETAALIGDGLESSDSSSREIQAAD